MFILDRCVYGIEKYIYKSGAKEVLELCHYLLHRSKGLWLGHHMGLEINYMAQSLTCPNHGFPKQYIHATPNHVPLSPLTSQIPKILFHFLYYYYYYFAF